MANKPKLVVVTEDFVSSAEKNYVVINEGTSAETKIGKLAISKILPALDAADDEARMDFALSVAHGQPFETKGGIELEKIIYGIAGRSESDFFHRSVKDIVESCLVLEPGGMRFDPKPVTDLLTKTEWSGMQREYANFRATDNYVCERVLADKPALSTP